MKCTCHTAPQGRHNLEGYILNEEYKYTIIRATWTKTGFCRIYLPDNSFCICGKKTFSLYFKKLEA